MSHTPPRSIVARSCHFFETALATIFTAALLSFPAPLQSQTPTDAPTRDDPGQPLIADTPAAIPSASAASITAIENTVLAAHDEMIAALEALDFDRLTALLVPTNRGALIADGRVTLATDAMVETIRREFAPLEHVHHTFARRHVALLSPTTALIVTEGTLTARAHDGATFTRPFAQTLVFMRIGDAWKIGHMHSSAPPATLGN